MLFSSYGYGFAAVARRFGLSDEAGRLVGSIDGSPTRVELETIPHHAQFRSFEVLRRALRSADEPYADLELSYESVVRITVALTTPLDMQLRISGGAYFPTALECFAAARFGHHPHAYRTQREWRGQPIVTGDCHFDGNIIAACQEMHRGHALMTHEVRAVLLEIAAADAGVLLDDRWVVVTLRSHAFGEAPLTRAMALAVLAAQAVQRARPLVPPPVGMNEHARMLASYAAHRGFTACGALWVRGEVGGSPVEIHGTNDRRVAARVCVGWGAPIEGSLALVSRNGGPIERACTLVLETVTLISASFWVADWRFSTFFDVRGDSLSFLKRLLTAEIRSELIAVAKTVPIYVNQTWLTAPHCDFDKAPEIAERFLSLAAMAQELLRPAHVASNNPYR